MTGPGACDWSLTVALCIVGDERGLGREVFASSGKDSTTASRSATVSVGLHIHQIDPTNNNEIEVNMHSMNDMVNLEDFVICLFEFIILDHVCCYETMLSEKCG